MGDEKTVNERLFALEYDKKRDKEDFEDVLDEIGILQVRMKDQDKQITDISHKLKDSLTGKKLCGWLMTAAGLFAAIQLMLKLLIKG